MSRCPFLSTHTNKVNCFKECLLHEYEDEDGKCPFMAVLDQMESEPLYLNKYKDFDDGNSVLEEIYRENNFLKYFEL